MNESDARRALLVRAYETLSPEQSASHWTEQDRSWATQAALQAEGEKASPDAFIGCRARLAVERIGSRDQTVHRVLSALTWRPWIGWALALAALVAGVATDALSSAKQISVLAPPLLAILAWSLAVYAVLLVRTAMRLAGNHSRHLALLTRQIARAAHAVTATRQMAGLSVPLAGFASAWNAASVPLTLARVAKILHVAAMAFAMGALLGIYLRGMALEYRAGWESTFLAAPTVHAILSTVLGPASTVTGIALPDVAGLAAIRFTVSPGENAARWIHLYTMTIALFVLGPRALLAFAAFVTERRLVRHFPLSLEDGYFQGLLRTQRGDGVKVHIVPYSYRLNSKRTMAIKALMVRAFGSNAAVTVAPTVAFGGEDALDRACIPAAPVSLVVALFSLTATPERENHGAFVDALAAYLPSSARLAVWVDESDFRRRFEATGATGIARLGERRGVWQRVFAHSGCEPLFVDLDQHDSNGPAQALRAAIDHAAAPAAHD